MEEGGEKMTVFDGVAVRRISTCQYYGEKRINDKSG